MVEQAIALLKHLGMTEYEARAYFSLIKHGSMTADKLSSRADIPLPRVYDTMGGLAERGLIFVSKTRPQTFKVIKPKKILELLKEDEKKKMEDRVKNIEGIIPGFLKILESVPEPTETDTEEVMAYIKRKVNMERLWFDEHNRAKHSILVFAGDLSWIAKTAPLIKKMTKKGINYKILWSKKSDTVKASAQKLLKIGVELKYQPDIGNLRGFIIDNNKVSFAETATGHEAKMIKPKTHESVYTTLVITNKTIVNVMHKYFNLLWKTGKPTNKVLRTRKK